MELLINLFDLNYVILTVGSTRLSLLELVGTVFGFICVWLTARENIWCWPIGILNIVCFFVMFYQLRLYSDMLLQVYFFATSIYGWWKWAHPKSKDEANRKNELRISRLSPRSLGITIVLTILGSLLFGTLILNIHLWLPVLFPVPAAFPYADSIVAVGSVTAQWIMAKKKLENWFFWIAIDFLACWIYFIKGVRLVSIEYLVYAGICFYGYLGWKKEWRGYAGKQR